MSEDDEIALAKHIARHIFKVGSEPTRRGGLVQRLQFMGGTYPTAEIRLGGLNEDALAFEIAQALREKEKP